MSDEIPARLSSADAITPPFASTCSSTLPCGRPALLAPHGITVGEFDVLAALRRGGKGTVLTPTTLARVAMISPAGMTNRLDRLEAAGLVDRRRDPDDRRGSLVGLTSIRLNDE